MSKFKAPSTWGLPDDMANKIGKAMSRKAVMPEDAVQQALEEIARDIAIIEPDPVDWGWWVTYLLDWLEAEADKVNKTENFDSMLLELRKYLVARNKRSE